MTGSEMIRPVRKISPPHSTSSRNPLGVERLSPIGSVAKLCDERRDHHEMTVDGEKHQDREQPEELPHDCGLRAALRIEEHREAQTHLQADELSGGLDRGRARCAK